MFPRRRNDYIRIARVAASSIGVALLACACSPADKPAAVPAATPVAAATGEVERLRAEVARLTAENAQLKETPSGLAAQVDAAAKASDVQRAQDAVKRLVERFPGSPEVQPSLQRVDALVAKLRASQEEARRLAALGFRGLKVAAPFTQGETSVNVRSAEVTKTWRYDSYGTGWKYVEAEKGQRFVVAHASVASTSENPALFGIAAYTLEGASLKRLGLMRYRFPRWQDFGSYLGNHADYRNDFAHSSSIPFTLGVAARTADLERKPIFLVATREGCHLRQHQRLAQPPVHYLAGDCATLKPTLTLDDFKDGSLAIVRRIE